MSEPLIYHATSPKKRLLKSLDHSEKLRVAHEAIVELKSNKDIADNFGIKETSVKSIVRSIKRNHEYLRDK
jgi:DNA-binding CsgD family transcriptional regulator